MADRSMKLNPSQPAIIALLAAMAKSSFNFLKLIS
jgi:hypothetical protein